MSTAILQKHRVVIASLFLPTTINFDEDAALRAPFVRGKDAMLVAAAPSSDEDAQNPNAIALSSPASPVAPSQPNKPPVRPRFDMRLKSIVDDLTLRVESGTPIQTPSAEAKPNPFSSFSALASAFVSQGGSTTPAGPRPSARVPTTPARTRRLSRSSSRIRSSSGTKVATTESSLPEFTYELSAHANGGLNNAIKASEPTLAKKLWVGVLDVPAQSIKEADRPRIQEKLRAEAESVAVWVTEDEFHKHYDVFCHQVLWPSLHYAIPDAPKTKTFYESTSFQQYKAVNQKFADTIVQEYQEGDVIWINDYHLLLVPEMVRAKLPNATIGFFLHVAFPSSEIFRCLSVRESLLRGMLGADLVGFQTHNYARHFRQTVSRILSLEALPGGINLENTSCEVAIFPIGIDVISLADKRGAQGTACGTNSSRLKHSWRNIRSSKVAVFDVVSRINSKFSTLTYQPIVFLHTQDLTFSQYLALLTAADAFFVASLREGMALRTHEFVECQEGKKHPSPLILSEFTGSYSYSGFRSCVSVNPWDARRTADALYTSLTMNEEESMTRWEDLHKHVTTQTAQAFVTSFVSRCVRTHMEHQRREFVQVPQIEPAKILAESDGAKHLIMIDWEGTLWSEDPRITWHSGFTPPPAKLEIVRKLLAKDRNQVWLLSGMGVQGGLEKIAAELPGVGLVAENGCMIKPPGQSEWVDLIPNFNREWKAPAIEILQYYTDRTPGTFIENRGASLCWRFGNEKRDEAAQKWVRRSAAEAQNHIWDSLGEQYGLRIIPGQSSFLILPKNVSRSTAVGTILSPGGLPSSQSSEITSLLSPVSAPLSISSSQAAQEAFGAILYIGADEHLIRRLNELPNVQTCAAGERDTFAHWRVHTADLGDVLGAFSA
ncbi:glycosyltransferase family 20 protein [Ceratobasidium sp. AG-Ba]|nr:glycosyltransferase family 20 protein [Ceratobasidium sp. AG-Ba]QRW03935.1 glycosyltransferase family 20 protein [Ceratobasidium sp. AG-Ba]